MNNSYPFEGKVRINETRTKLAARSKPHILDDATVNRVIRSYTEQLEFAPIYERQLVKWQQETDLSSAQL
ncbi:hypothetical protein [Oceanobacillus profundus]|uniref:Uncharacterized protein n=1 Tax=Oceanobacillus profundus TaxID=372463 RepID=A0A417Y9M8_9BACI|nr:hypothetical protein [Oceanobacillus profundus]MBR3121687.1 hypothetical protein [Oceanobacillus sp.]PAE30247.1 hypothetical protein CHI07_05100 [Paenibacillus sp. 7884-2]MCM3399426.1 hypothetical protein [Oceanobacillus profundus]MDO6450469.1 hypothetical protein [Oceanobacillus profundus]RHW29224.1 hypothetical protein D1B32_23305 [Oceanobacillus profundus]